MNIESLTDLAREAEKHGKTIDAGVRWCEKYLRDHPVFHEAVFPELVQCAMRGYLERVRGQERKKVKLAVQNGRGLAGIRAVTEAARETRSLLDSWQIANKWLGDLTHEEMCVEAATAANRAMGNEINARFFAALAGRTPEGEAIRSAWKPGEVDALYAKIVAEVEKGRKATA